MTPLGEMHARAGNLIVNFTHDLPEDQRDIDQIATQLAPYVENQAHLEPGDQQMVRDILQNLEEARVWFNANARPLAGRAQPVAGHAPLGAPPPELLAEEPPQPAQQGILEKIMSCIKRAFEWLKNCCLSLLCCRRTAPQPGPQPGQHRQPHRAGLHLQRRPEPRRNAGAGGAGAGVGAAGAAGGHAGAGAGGAGAGAAGAAGGHVGDGAAGAAGDAGAGAAGAAGGGAEAGAGAAGDAGAGAGAGAAGAAGGGAGAGAAGDAGAAGGADGADGADDAGEELVPIDFVPIVNEMPDRVGDQPPGDFLGTLNQYGAGMGVGINVGTAACSFCALNMLRRLWGALEANKALDNTPQTQNFIDAVVTEGTQIRRLFKPAEVGIDDHVAVADAWEGAFPELQFFAVLEEGGADIVAPEGNGRRTYANEINRFQRWAIRDDNPSHMLGATLLKGPETHVILVDMRNRHNPRYYHSDSHGRGGGPAYVRVFDNPNQFAQHLATVAPYVAGAGDEINRLQIFPYTVAAAEAGGV